MSDFLPSASRAELPATPEQEAVAFRGIPNVFNPNALSPEERGAFFATVEARQAEIDGILESAKTPDHASEELNARFNGDWDDEQGLAFLHILGVDLPNLEIHGRAKGLVISSSRLVNPNFSGADLEASIFSMSVLKGINARGANLNMAVMPFSQLSGDLTDVQAVDANFNLATLAVRAHRANFTNAFLIGTAGVTPKNLEEARFKHAVFTGPQQQRARSASSQVQTLRRALAGSFNEAKGEQPTQYRMPVVHQGVDARYGLEAARTAEGQLWYGVDLSDARLAEFKLVASVLADVSMARANASSMRAPGLVTIEGSTFSGISAREAWMPGSVHVGTDFTNADFTDMHMPGSVLVAPMIAGIIAEGANVDGMVIVTDSPKHAEAMQEQTNTRMTILKPSDLTTEVMSIITKAKSIPVSGSSSQRALKK